MRFTYINSIGEKVSLTVAGGCDDLYRLERQFKHLSPSKRRLDVQAGYMESGRPFGITFAGTAYSEGILIKLAFAFEQATKLRKAPKFNKK